MPTKKTKKERTYKIRECPECKSDSVNIVVGRGGRKKDWECKKCSWKGQNIIQKELSQEKFLSYLDEKGGDFVIKE